MSEEFPNPVRKLSFYLPFGEMLRVLLEQTATTQASIRAVLRERGVFLRSYDKDVAIPCLAFATITPKEFGLLLEDQRVREDAPKTSDCILEWGSDKTVWEALKGIVPRDLLASDVVGRIKSFSGVEVVSGDKDHLKIDFKLERNNLHKSWAVDRTMHDGCLEIKKVFDGKKVNLVVVSSIPETKRIADGLRSRVEDVLKARGHVPPQALHQKICFGSLGNDLRIKFFLSLTKADTAELTFEAIVDYDLRPDRAKPLPPEIDGFLKEVKEMILKGDSLHKSFFIRNTKFHKFVILSEMTVKFFFSYSAAKGSATVRFGFCGYPGKDSSQCEFEFELVNISLDKEFRHISTRPVWSKVRSFLQEFVLEQEREFLKELAV